MSFDFFPQAEARTLDKAASRPSRAPDPGLWAGAASLTMEGLAKTARAVDLLGAVGPLAIDAVTGGTTESDAYFQEHDELFNSAVSYWTPNPAEVGTAGRIVGSVVPVLANVMVSPALAVGAQSLGTAEDLAREGVPAGKAVTAGVVQSAGLGVGIWAPIFGSTLAQRVFLGGAAANVAQGVVTDAATQVVLAGEKAAERYNPWDLEARGIDLLLGMAFGGAYHAGRAPGDSAFKDMAEAIRTSGDEAALLAVNQARHLEDTTAPGIPATAADATAHAAAMKKAVDDLLNGREVSVEQLVAEVRFGEDPAKIALAREMQEAIGTEARAIVLDAIAAEQGGKVPKGKALEELTTPIERLPVKEAKVEPAPPPKEGEGKAEPADPVLAEAAQRLARNPKMEVEGGFDADGNPIRRSAAEVLAEADALVARAKESGPLFDTAAACLIGEL